MKITVKTGKLETMRTDAAVIMIVEGEKSGPVAARVDKALGGMVQRLIKRGEFTAKPGSVCLLYPEGKIAAERLIVVGLGKRADLTPDRLRLAAGKAAAAGRSAGAKNIVVAPEGYLFDPAEAGQALAEGCTLGLYRFLKYKSKDENNGKKEIASITVLTEKASNLSAFQKGVRTGEIIAAQAAMVRDMVNSPSADMTPTVIAGIAKGLARKHRLKVQVLERDRMRKLGMGALLGVAPGASSLPSSSSSSTAAAGRSPSSPLSARPSPSIPAASRSSRRRTWTG